MTNERDHRNVKALSLLYFLGAGIYGLIAVAALLADGVEPAMKPVLAVVFALLSAGMFATGVGLRRFQKWAWTVAVVLACMNMLGFPIGTIVGGIILFALIRARGFFFEPLVQQTQVEPNEFRPAPGGRPF
jgi:hypothetical protein